MNIKLIRSLKHKGSVFLKERHSRNHFICKVYPQATQEETERLAGIVKRALEDTPSEQERTEPEDDGSMSLGEEQAMRQAGAYGRTRYRKENHGSNT